MTVPKAPAGYKSHIVSRKHPKAKINTYFKCEQCGGSAAYNKRFCSMACSCERVRQETIARDKERPFVVNPNDHMRLVYKILYRILRTREFLDTEEFAEGCLGLMHACRYFKKSKKLAFSTYATHCIKGYVMQCITRKRKYHNRFPIAESGIDEYYGGSKVNYVGDIPDKQYKKTSAVEETTKEVQRLLRKLDKRERFVMQCRWGLNGKDQLSLVEIGKILKVSKERVRQIEHGVVIKLREKNDRIAA
mgnify:CR=1 FL=1